MTLIPKTKPGEYSAELPAEFSAAELADLLGVYCANPLFRSARFEELEIDDDPYRRPVRPEDLSFLRYDRPFGRADSSRLSALIGHRMLLNIHDTAKPMFAEKMTPGRWEEYRLFYGARNRVLGELVRPLLEEHVFGFVHGAVAEQTADAPVPDVAALRSLLTAVAEQRGRAAGEVLGLVAEAGAADEAAKMTAVQLLAGTINAPLRVSPLMIPAAGGGDGAAALTNGRREPHRIDDVLSTVMEACGFGVQPHRYYQYYLPSTLAAMNYLNATARDYGRVFEFLGAMCVRTLDSLALIGGHGARLAELAGPADTASTEATLTRTAPTAEAETAAAIDEITRTVVEPLARRFGTHALAAFDRGAREYAVLLDVHHDDLTIQLRWIDSAPAYRAKAERLQAAIDEHHIPVALDTFVESSEECSTTHVHDDDRLLVIESGEMEFWNCFSGTHKFRPGDKLFIPKHRLHGSVVLSGECVYHQPVINGDLDRRYG
jgi:mannose-6-phosphate isomerase-like protein (cupin superfamily)